MNQYEDRVLLRHSVETPTVAYDLLTICNGLEAEVTEFVILYVESFCGSHDVRFGHNRCA
jgi:hypothetical protein